MPHQAACHIEKHSEVNLVEPTREGPDLRHCRRAVSLIERIAEHLRDVHPQLTTQTNQDVDRGGRRHCALRDAIDYLQGHRLGAGARSTPGER